MNPSVCRIKKAHRVVLESSLRDKTTYPRPDSFVLNLNTNFTNVSEIDIQHIVVPNTMFTVDKYNCLLKFVTSEDPAPIYLVLKKGHYNDSNMLVEFNFIMSTSTWTDVQPGITDIEAEIDNIQATGLSGFFTTASISAFTGANYQLTQDSNNNKFIMTPTGATITYKGGPSDDAYNFSANNVFGLNANIGTAITTATTFTDIYNFAPVRHLYLRLSNGEEEFRKISLGSNSVGASGSVIQGETAFCVIPVYLDFGSFVFWSKNHNYETSYLPISIINNINKLKVEWLRLDGSSLNPVDFKGVDNTILIDIYSSYDRSVNKCR